MSKAVRTAELTTIFLATLSDPRLWIPLACSLRGYEIWVIISAVQSAYTVAVDRAFIVLPHLLKCVNTRFLSEAVVIPSSGTCYLGSEY